MDKRKANKKRLIKIHTDIVKRQIRKKYKDDIPEAIKEILNMDPPADKADIFDDVKKMARQNINQDLITLYARETGLNIGLSEKEIRELIAEAYHVQHGKISKKATKKFADMISRMDKPLDEQDIDVPDKKALVPYMKYEGFDIYRKGDLSKDEIRMKDNKKKVINRINEIISKVNDESMGGRYTNYIRGGTGKGTGRVKRGTRKYPSTINQNYNYEDPQTGLQHLSQSPDGYDLQQSMYPEGKMMQLDKEYQYQGGGSYGHSLNYKGAGGNYSLASIYGGGEYMPIGGKVKRKQRVDKGKKRGESNWIQFVRAVCNEYDLPYKQGMSKASKLRKQGYTLDDFA